MDPAARAPWAPEAMNALFDADGVRIDENKMGGVLETTELRADTKFIPLSIAHPAAQRQLVFDAPSGAADTPDDTTGMYSLSSLLSSLPSDVDYIIQVTHLV